MSDAVIPAEKEYTLHVWVDGSRVAKTYHIIGRPSLAHHTNDVAMQFITDDGKELFISSNCKWTIKEK